MILGYLFAVLGALGSGTGSVLESVAVTRSGAYGGDSDDLGRVARQPLYWTGVTIDILGFVCAAAALHRLPLFLVQSVMAFSVGVTATISAFLGHRLPRRGWVALAVAALGLVLLAVSADPGPARALPPGWHWVMLSVAVPVGAIGYFGSRTRRRWTAPLLGFAAGLGFTAVAVSARTLRVPDDWWRLILEPGVLSIVANGVVATVVFALALQKGGATSVSAIMFTTNTVVPSAIGVLVLGDAMRPGYVVVGVAGFIFAVAGAVALAHYSALAGQPHSEMVQVSRAVPERA